MCDDLLNVPGSVAQTPDANPLPSDDEVNLDCLADAAMQSVYSAPLPPHDFHIGENNHATIDQLPNFRAMAFHVIGKAPMLTPVIHVDPISMGVYSLGSLIGDAALKLLRPWPLYGSDAFSADPAQTLILEIADALPLSPIAENVRVSFLCRMGEFLEIALHHPGRLPAIIANIDALTNARLTERARETLTTGIDPGASDLWGEDRPGWATAPTEGARHE